MDGIIISSLVQELKTKILGFNIKKIYQPDPNEIILVINKNKLLISINPSCPRVYITEQSKENPLNAPMFCMILRKYIQGGRIINISQPNFDRIINLDIESISDFGDKFFYRLIIEIMGRHSNIILINNKNIILDSAKHVDFKKSSIRQVLPNLIYKMPPNENKLDITKTSKKDFLDLIKTNQEPYKIFNGLGKIISQEIIFRYEHDFNIDELYDSIIKNNYQNQIVFKMDSDEPFILSAIDLKKYSNTEIYIKKNYDSISKAIQDFYFNKAKTDFLKQKAHDLYKLVSNNISRCKKKIEIYQKDYDQTKNKDLLKLLGELIISNVYQIKNNSEFFIANNYYDDNKKIKIELDKNLSAVQNAQVYFKKYNRQKRAQLALTQQINKNKLELDYFESILQNLSLCQTEDDIEYIRQELYQQKIIKSNSKSRLKSNNTKKIDSDLLLCFISSDGFEIYVGRNNIQNDFLTLKFAKSYDIWLHTKNIPSAHVVISTNKKNVSQITLEQAASICAFYSKACNSNNIAVDYTQIKFVKKIADSKPGMVNYKNYKTIFVTPDKNLINNLRFKPQKK